ncbi:hypothetical protein K438DRAFT_1778997 [Mycena galopus ATCC 62051]|nr:hypothetical protein K438DRAFT_1778997 [Mycena galopus ATCC 62051]
MSQEWWFMATCTSFAIDLCKGHLQLFHHTFAEGTAAKPHKTISVDIGNYSESLELELVQMNPYNAPLLYLVNCALTVGLVQVAVRGKCLALTAGYHTLLCHFSLEGNLLTLSKDNFDNIVATCIPGNNKNLVKANRLQLFPLPQRKVISKVIVHILVYFFPVSHAVLLIHNYQALGYLSLEEVSRGPDWIVETDTALAGLNS